MALIGFNHYNIRAPRPTMEVLRAFYCEVVGLRLGERPALRSFGYWLYIGEKDVLHLSESAADEVRLTDQQTTFDHVAFTATDQAAMEARLTQHGVQFISRSVSATGVNQVFFRDPAGNGIEFNFALDG